MSASTSPTPVSFGFFGLCEGILLSLATGWWLHGLGQPPIVFVGAAIVVASLYFIWLSTVLGSAFNKTVMIGSILIWAVVGWRIGEQAYYMFASSKAAMTVLDAMIGWKIIGAVVCACVAYTDKAARIRGSRP